MKEIFSSVDIGSSSIKIVVSELFNDKLNTLASTIYPSSGVKNGIIINEELFTNSLKEAFKEINSSLGVKVDKAIINVPMFDSEYLLSEGSTTITNENKVVTGTDMVNALQGSIYNKIDKTKELVTIMPVKYNVDTARQDILKPRGLRANKLTVTSMSAIVPKKDIYKVISIFQNIGIEVVDILFGIIGDYHEFKTEKNDKSVTGVINIGSDKTEIAVFNRGIIANSKVINVGSKIIENDISYVYNIKKSQGKKLKETFALAHKDFASTSDIYEIVNKSNIKTKITQYEISEIVMSRLKEMLENAKKELNHLTKKEISYIIVSGGITNIPGFDILCKEVLGESAMISTIKTIGVRNNSYSSSHGMIKYFIDKLSIRGKDYTMFNEEKQLGLVENRKDNNQSDTESMFGRLFSYLFDNKED
jgi:cell division protein FtsA